MRETPTYYSLLPAHVRYDKDLKPMAKIMYSEIVALTNKAGYCYSKNLYFAELYEVDKATISRWISQLEKKKYVQIHLIYKPGTKQVLQRHIVPNVTPVYVPAPIDQMINTPIQNDQHPIDLLINTPIQNDQPPIDQKIKDNNTSINNTSLIITRSNNKKDPVTTGINPVGDDLFNLNLSKEDETLNPEDLDQVRKDLEHLKPPEKPKEKSCAKKEKGTTVERVLENFTDCFLISFGFNYSIKPQDYRFIKLIIQLYKDDNPELNDQTVEASIKTMFGAFNKVKDTWLLKSMSPQIIYSKWNRFKIEMAGITETKKQYTYSQATKIILDNGRGSKTLDELFTRKLTDSGSPYYVKNY